ncbi:MAG: hypothetical protein ACI4Q8_05510 [Ruminococcus sp.]
MKKLIMKSVFCVTLVVFMLFSTTSSNAAKAPSISRTSKSIYAGSYGHLKVSNANGKVKWSSNKRSIVKIVSTSNKNSCRVTIKGVKKGSATITARVGGKTLKCKVTVNYKTSTPSAKVYITETGTKYHTSGCRTLRSSKYAVDLSWAKSNGYEACKICH